MGLLVVEVTCHLGEAFHDFDKKSFTVLVVGAEREILDFGLFSHLVPYGGAVQPLGKFSNRFKQQSIHSCTNQII